MVVTIKSGSSKKEINKALNQLKVKFKPKKGLDAGKYCGTVKFKEDAVRIQKRLREEWE